MNYEKDLESPYSYFKYCGIFDSCLNNEIRIFPFLPLTTNPQSDAQSDAQSDESDNINTRNTVSSMIPPRKTVSPNIPFQLPFP